MTKTKFQRWHVIAVVILSVLTLLITSDYIYHRNRIYAGVVIDGVNVSRKTSSEAIDLLTQKYAEEGFNDRTIQVEYADEEETLTFAELGVAVDLETMVDLAMDAGRDRIHLFRYFDRLALRRDSSQINPRLTIATAIFQSAISPMEEWVWQEAQDAQLKLSDDRERVEILPDTPGQELDVAATRDQLLASLKSYPDPIAVQLVEKTVEAEQTTAYLESLEITEPIATFSTVFSGNDANRNHNIGLAASAVDDILLLPEEEFSFNNTVGDTTAEKGYKNAPIILDGELVDGLGGGICQVSSTLYNTVLFADVSITERRNHGLAVGYLPPGRDATIAYGWIDLKYVNDRDSAVWQRAFVDGNRLTVTLYGKSIPGHEVEITTTDLETIPSGEKLIKTPQLALGVRERIKNGQPGYKVTAWRITYIDGEEIRREKLSQDTYKAVPAEYRVGTAEVPATSEVEEDEDEENENHEN